MGNTASQTRHRHRSTASRQPAAVPEEPLPLPAQQSRMSSKAERARADLIKAEGNLLFKKSRYSAAAERYTEAIAEASDLAVLYVNRSLCYRKLGKWQDCASDARKALTLESNNMKAHYFLGIALRHESKYDESARCLEKALEAARKKEDAVKDEIWRELAACKYGQWQHQASERTAKRDRLRTRLGLMIDMYYRKHPDEGARRQDEQALFEILQLAGQQDSETEVHNAYTCVLTMEPFRDPVCTPAGNTYEHAALLDHLRKVGLFDPVSHTKLTERDLIINHRMRMATQQYLDEHPCCWGECVNPTY